MSLPLLHFGGTNGAQIANSVGIIGGADGPPAVVVSGVIGIGNVVLEIVIGVLLVGAGTWA